MGAITGIGRRALRPGARIASHHKRRSEGVKGGVGVGTGEGFHANNTGVSGIGEGAGHAGVVDLAGAGLAALGLAHIAS